MVLTRDRSLINGKPDVDVAAVHDVSTIQAIIKHATLFYMLTFDYQGAVLSAYSPPSPSRFAPQLGSEPNSFPGHAANQSYHRAKQRYKQPLSAYYSTNSQIKVPCKKTLSSSANLTRYTDSMEHLERLPLELARFADTWRNAGVHRDC